MEIGAKPTSEQHRVPSRPCRTRLFPLQSYGMQAAEEDIYRIDTSISAGRRVTRLFRVVRHGIYARTVKIAVRLPFLRSWLVERFSSDLRDLNDLLERTSLRGHYRLMAGLLLGWAREGGIMPHDVLDADIAINDEEFHRMTEVVPALLKAGFKCRRRFINNDRQLTEVTFARHGASFDFFRLFSDGSSFRYYLYDTTTEYAATIPSQEAEPFSFLDRTWLKSKDHALELKSIYGPWEIPDPSFSYLDCLSIESSRPARYLDFEWRGGLAALAFDKSLRMPH
jgi:hypothetical protein